MVWWLLLRNADVLCVFEHTDVRKRPLTVFKESCYPCAAWCVGSDNSSRPRYGANHKGPWNCIWLSCPLGLGSYRGLLMLPDKTRQVHARPTHSQFWSLCRRTARSRLIGSSLSAYFMAAIVATDFSCFSANQIDENVLHLAHDRYPAWTSTRLDFQSSSVTKERQNYVQRSIKIESDSKNFRSKFRNLVGQLPQIREVKPAIARAKFLAGYCFHIPDETFHSFRASRSGDWRSLCCSGSSI